LKHPLLRWALLPVIAAIVLVADQWTKGLVERNIPLWGSFAPFPALAPYFNIVHYTNTGAAFGLLQGQWGLLAVVAIVVIVAVLLYASQLPTDPTETGLRNWAIRFCLGLQLGGAAGNLTDRLQHGGRVTDFLLFSLPVGDRVYVWPAWNVADGSIVVGVILLAIPLLWGERKTVEGEKAKVGG